MPLTGFQKCCAARFSKENLNSPVLKSLQQIQKHLALNG
jgi:hypothetical protein